MNTLTDSSVSGSQPDLSLPPQAAAAAVAEIATVVAPNLRKWNRRRIKDILVLIYAYGLLGFGIFFPLVLAAWAAIFWPDVR